MATSSRPSIPAKSPGLQVQTGIPFATGVTAITRRSAERSLAAGPTQRRGHLPKRSSANRIERDRVEITLCLLQVRLSSSPLLLGVRHVTYRL